MDYYNNLTTIQLITLVIFLLGGALWAYTVFILANKKESPEQLGKKMGVFTDKKGKVYKNIL